MARTRVVIIGKRPWMSLFATTNGLKKSFYGLILLWLLFSVYTSLKAGELFPGLVVFSVMMVPLFLFYKYKRNAVKIGKDEKIITNMREFLKSRKLPPALVGLLVDEYAGSEEVAATILDLTVRGYLDMRELPKGDVEFFKTNKKQEGLREYEWLVLAALFGDRKRVRASELYNKFFKNLKRIEESIYEEGVIEGLFASKPNETRINFLKNYKRLFSYLSLVSLSWFFLMIFFLAGLNTFLRFYTSIIFWVSLMSLVVLKVLSYVTPKKTAKGVRESLKYLEFEKWLSENPIKEVNLGTEFVEYLTVFGINPKYLSVLHDLFEEETRGKEGSRTSIYHWYDAG